MPDKLTVRMTRWRPTRYATVVAFMAANRAECKTNEDRRHAMAVLDAVSDAYHAARPDVDELSKRSFNTPDWNTHCDKFDEANPSDVLLVPGAFAWLKRIVEAIPDSGAFARLRVRADVSFEEAKEEDVTVQSPEAAAPPRRGLRAVPGA